MPRRNSAETPWEPMSRDAQRMRNPRNRIRPPSGLHSGFPVSHLAGQSVLLCVRSPLSPTGLHRIRPGAQALQTESRTMPDYAHIASTLTSPEGFLALSDEPQVFGAKKQAKSAFDLWNQASERYVGAYQGFTAPGGSGTGFVIRTFWDPSKTTPDLGAVAVAINTALPVELTRSDEKATYKGRDKKQGTFFAWQGMSSRPLSQWFLERFGIGACATQLFDRSDLSQDIAVVAISGGVDHLWSTSAK